MVLPLRTGAKASALILGTIVTYLLYDKSLPSPPGSITREPAQIDVEQVVKFLFDDNNCPRTRPTEVERKLLMCVGSEANHTFVSQPMTLSYSGLDHLGVSKYANEHASAALMDDLDVAVTMSDPLTVISILSGCQALYIVAKRAGRIPVLGIIILWTIWLLEYGDGRWVSCFFPLSYA